MNIKFKILTIMIVALIFVGGKIDAVLTDYTYDWSTTTLSNGDLLTVQGTFTLDDSLINNFTLADVTNVMFTASISGNVNIANQPVDVLNLASFPTINVVAATALSGITSLNLTFPATFASTLDIDNNLYDFTQPTSGPQIAPVAVVPEPATYLSLATVLLITAFCNGVMRRRIQS